MGVSRRDKRKAEREKLQSKEWEERNKIALSRQDKLALSRQAGLDAAEPRGDHAGRRRPKVATFVKFHQVSLPSAVSAIITSRACHVLCWVPRVAKAWEGTFG